MEDELLDNLKWNDAEQYSGIMTMANGKTAAFTIVDVDETDGSMTEATRNTIKLMIVNESLIRHKIAASMIELYRGWNDGDTITPEELAQRIELSDVTFWAEGGGDLLYTAGDIFAGHCIHTLFNAQGEIDQPSLEG